MNTIKHKMPVTELLAGLAEECSELAQAALKLPVSEEDAIEKFYEEIADVKLYCSTLDIPARYISEIMAKKQKRWEERLMK